MQSSGVLHVYSYSTEYLEDVIHCYEPESECTSAMSDADEYGEVEEIEDEEVFTPFSPEWLDELRRK